MASCPTEDSAIASRDLLPRARRARSRLSLPRTRPVVYTFAAMARAGPKAQPPVSRMAGYSLCRVRRARDAGGQRRLRRAGRARGGVRQRRHAVVREADADRARVHPARIAAMAEDDASLRDAPALEGRLREGLRVARRAITKHYQGDESDVQAADRRDRPAVRRHERRGLRGAPAPSSTRRRHPTLGRRYPDCGYAADGRAAALPRAPRVHRVHRLGRQPRLHADRSPDMYGIPPHRVIGSTSGLRYEPDDRGGNVVYKAEMDLFDHGPVKPIRIWSRIGRRPNSPPATRTATSRCSTSPAAGRGAAPARQPRRPRARVRLHGGGRASLERPAHRAGRWSASRTTGRPSSPEV